MPAIIAPKMTPARPISAAIIRGSMPLVDCAVVEVEEVAVATGVVNCAMIFNVAAEALAGFKLKSRQSEVRRSIGAITSTIACTILRCIALSLI